VLENNEEGVATCTPCPRLKEGLPATRNKHAKDGRN
jgi:hypothetical protein